MANQNTSGLMFSSESSESSRTHFAKSNSNHLQPPSNQQLPSSIRGPVAILWDIENCSVPCDVRPEDVAGNIRKALLVHPVINGAVKMFSAYGDFNAFTRRLREGCQRTGVRLIDVPNGRKDAADKAILVDLFLFALDNRPPSSIMLISGDVDFAPALHILGQRGYTVILVIPSGVCVSSALSNAGRFVWDWPSVARGEGFAPPTKALIPPRGATNDIAACLMGCHISENPDGHNEEEAIVYRGISQSYCNSKESSMVSQSLSEYTSRSEIGIPGFPATLRSQSLPSGMHEVSGKHVRPGDQNESIQPGDLNGLKGQLIELLELSGGCLPLTCVPAEYQKLFGRPPEYGSFNLVNLSNKMGDTMAVEEKGHEKFVYLRNVRSGPSAPPLVMARKEKKGKGIQKENVDKFKKMGDARAVRGKGQKKVVHLRNVRSGPSAPPLVTAKKEKKGKGIQKGNVDITGNGTSNKFSADERAVVKKTEENLSKKKKKLRGQPVQRKPILDVELESKLKKTGDAKAVRGKGQKKSVHLQNVTSGPKSRV